MLPGKTYSPEDLLLILRRRFWLLVLPLAVVTAGTSVVARMLPNRFRSEAVILVVPQQVPTSYVRSTVTTGITDRLDTISQQILSRTHLESIIEDLNLYVEERKTGIMEDIVQSMRKDISVAVVKGDASFKVSYEGSSPKTVQTVADRLASLFIEDNLRDRAVMAEGTDQFLGTQLEDARRRLQDQEKKLEQYRMKYSGQLPTQVTANLQSLQNVQMQIQARLDSMDRDQDRHLMIERQLADLQGTEDPAPAPAVGTPTTSATDNAGSVVGPTLQQLADARNILAGLEARGLKPDHPDVQHVRRVIRDLEQKAEAEALQTPISSPALVTTSPLVPDNARQRRIQDLQEELDALNGRIAAAQDEEKRLREVGAEYQRKVDAVPERESELVELTRDYSTIQVLYTTLLTKKEESQIAANLERRQIGEQFKLLDPARIPERPVSPNRMRINLMGVGIGLGIGIALIALLEYRSSTFETDDDITRLLTLPVLAVVPIMQSEIERRQVKRRSLIVGLGLGSTALCCFAIAAYALFR